MAGAAPTTIQGDSYCGNARPLFLRQCRRLDSRIGPWRGDSLEGELQLLARSENQAYGARREASFKTP